METNRRYYRIPPPRNGKYYKALLAGGPADVATEIKDRLIHSSRVLVVEHWAYDKPKAYQRPIPEDVDLAIILKDMASHSLEGAVKTKAKAKGIRVIRTQRKWAALRSALVNYRLHEEPKVIKFLGEEEAERIAQKAEQARHNEQELQRIEGKLQTEQEVAAPQIREESEAPAVEQEVPAQDMGVIEAIFDEWVPEADGQIMAAVRILARHLSNGGFSSVEVRADGTVRFKMAGSDT